MYRSAEAKKSQKSHQGEIFAFFSAEMIQPTHLDEGRTVRLCRISAQPASPSPVWLTKPLTWHHINLHSCSATWEIHAIILSLHKYLFQLRTKQAADELLDVRVENCMEGECQKQTAYLCHFNKQYLIQISAIRSQLRGLWLKDLLPESLWLVFQPVHHLSSCRVTSSSEVNSLETAPIQQSVFSLFLLCVWSCSLSGWIWPQWTSSQRGFSLHQDARPFKGQHTKLYTTAHAGKKAMAVKQSWRVDQHHWILRVHMEGTRVGQSRWGSLQLSTIRLDDFLPAWPGIHRGLRERHRSWDP